MDFRTVAAGATIQLDGGRGDKAFKCTLGSAANALSLVNFESGDEIYLRLIQDSTGSRTVTWPSYMTFAGGAAPALSTTAAAVDTLKLKKVDGSTWVCEAPSRPLARIASAIAATIVVGSIAGSYVQFSNGGANQIGNLGTARFAELRAGTGSTASSGTLLAIVGDGSGSYKTGVYGGIAVGMNNPKTDRLDAASNSGSWLPNGNFKTRGTINAIGGAFQATLTAVTSTVQNIIRATLSGSVLKAGGGVVTADSSGITTSQTVEAGTASGNALTISGLAGTDRILCPKADGTVGYMTVTATGTLIPICN